MLLITNEMLLITNEKIEKQIVIENKWKVIEKQID